jgi:hypothetical protein
LILSDKLFKENIEETFRTKNLQMSTDELRQTAITINDLAEKMAKKNKESDQIVGTIPNRMVEGNIVIQNPKTRMTEHRDESSLDNPDIVDKIGKDDGHANMNLEMKKELDEARQELKD